MIEIRFGNCDWDERLGLQIEIGVWGLGLEIVDQDFGLGLSIGIKILDWGMGLKLAYRLKFTLEHDVYLIGWIDNNIQMI